MAKTRQQLGWPSDQAAECKHTECMHDIFMVFLPPPQKKKDIKDSAT